jgi:hypothetical protein
VGGGGPSARGDVVAALDVGVTKMVVHGGDSAYAVCPAFPTPKHESDTWVMEVGCGAWKKIEGDSPGSRARAAMATDSQKNRAVLFGGRTRAGASGAYTLFNDVWAFDFGAEAWSKIETTGQAPSARANAAAAYDAKGNRLLVFGGNTSTSGTAFAPQNDTWALDLGTNAWSKLAGQASPPARLFHAMAVDAEGRRAWTFSGGDDQAFTGPFLGDLWQMNLDTGAWSQIQAAGEAPRPRIKHAMLFDAKGKRVLVFGGHDDGQVGNQNDVHALDVSVSPPVWSRVGGGDVFNKPSTGQCAFPADFTTIDKNAPERRESFAFAPRADGRGFYVWGGKGDCGVLADGWWFAGGANAWAPMKQSPLGLSCLRVSTTCTGLCG